jgi:citrate lyase beta subunit
LPKIVMVDEVATLAEILEALESRLHVPAGRLGIELLIETPQFLTACGGALIPHLLSAARGRCRGAALGIYDLTAACEVVAAHQALGHPTADFARTWLKASLAGSGLHLGDSGSHAIPVGAYRQSNGGPPLTVFELERNRQTVRALSKRNYDDIRHSLRLGFYQGMDLHPSQLGIRYAAVYAFFLEQVKEMTLRLRAVVDARAGASHQGDFLDDAANGQALLNFFLRGIACGALHADEAAATGLSLEEISSRSFQNVLDARWQLQQAGG